MKGLVGNCERDNNTVDRSKNCKTAIIIKLTLFYYHLLLLHSLIFFLVVIVGMIPLCTSMAHDDRRKDNRENNPFVGLSFMQLADEL